MKNTLFVLFFFFIFGVELLEGESGMHGWADMAKAFIGN